MRTIAPLLLFLAAPFLLALQFTAPAGGSTYVGDAVAVNFTWDQQPVTFTVTGSAPVELNTTNTSVTLTPGSYLATVSSGTGNNTSTASVSFTVSAPANQNVTVSADQTTYEVLSAARIRVTVSQPSQLSLVIKRDGQQVDSYTLNVQQQTDFLYTLQATGAYTVQVTGDSVSATTQFSVQNTTLGVSVSGASTASTGKVVSYTSSVSGGTPPYTYHWQFSDNTTSTQQNADHVYADAGSYTALLLVTDSQNKQASAQLNTTVSEQTYRLTVTVLGEGNRLLSGAVIVLTDNRSGGRSDTTDSFGDVKFKNLTQGNYTLNVSYSDTAQSPAVLYTASKEIEIIDDRSATVTLPVPDPDALAVTSTETTPADAAASETVDPASETAADETLAAKQAATAESTSDVSFVSADERAALEDHRAEVLADLHSRVTTMTVSDDKQRMVTLLGLQPVFDRARSSVETAADIGQIDAAMAVVPKDISIVPRDTTVEQYADAKIDSELERFFAARSITDSAEQKKYRYSIEQMLPDTTVTMKRSIVRVLSANGQPQATYTVFTRSVKAPEAAAVVEFIPKTVAADASKLHVDGSHEVLDADPVLRFLSTSYSYYVSGEVADGDSPTLLPVPLELQEPPSLIGLIAGKLNLGVAGMGGLAIVLVGALIGVVVAGNVILRRNTASSSLAAFTELGDLALTTLSQGNYATVAKYAQDLQAIHDTLSPQEQALTADVMGFIAEAQAVHDFRSAVTAVRTVIELQDVNAVSGAYERVMHHYESLSEGAQAREQELFHSINNELETFVATGNSGASIH